MNKEKINDQEWQQLQFRINEMVGKFLKDENTAIEYKPGSAPLMPPLLDYQNNDIEKMRATG